MMKCEDARAYVDAWEAGEPSPWKPGDFSAHLSACPRCESRYGALVGAMERDGAMERTADAARARNAPDIALSNAVIEAIYRPESRLKPFAAAGHRTRRSRRLYPALAAAAALVFFLGIGFGIYFSRYGGPGSGMVTVRFSIEAPQASKVALAGDFTGWSDEEYELRRVGKTGTWEIRIPLERGKAYVYNFVIDGSTWVPDPAVPAKIADGFGGSGSLLRL